jgi:YcaO-like protein with predicted kinase domain
VSPAASSSGPAPSSGDAIPVAPVLKAHRRGTHRALALEETVERVRALMPSLGITRVANITGLDAIGIPVVTVCRPNARSISVSQGKGLTLTAAKASGLMESLESYHAEHPRLPLLRESYAERRATSEVVDPTGLPRSSASSFHEHLRTLWVEGQDLLGERRVWVPFELVHTDFTLPLPAGSGSFLMSSNGLSSGNHLLEAVSHGICEVVERDATTLWSCSTEEAKRETRIDLATVDDPDCLEVLDKYERAGVAVAAWETTTDVGIPAFLCTIAERSPSRLRPLPPMSGMGCHPARGVALLRALTEAAQGRLTMIAGSRDGYIRYTERLDADLTRRTQATMRAEGRRRSFADVPTREAESFDADVAWEVERLRAAGLGQAVVVDLTRPDIRIPVVRVIIPGLESMHDVPGYVPGARARRRLMERDA